MIANLTQKKFTTDIFRGTFSDIFREATFEKDCDGLSVCLSVCLSEIRCILFFNWKKKENNVP